MKNSLGPLSVVARWYLSATGKRPRSKSLSGGQGAKSARS